MSRIGAKYINDQRARERARKNLAVEREAVDSNKSRKNNRLKTTQIGRNVPEVDDIDLSSEEMMSGTATKVRYTNPILRPSSLGTIRLPTAAVSYYATPIS